MPDASATRDNCSTIKLRQNYRCRITELRDEQAEARTLGRVERAEEAEREMDALVAELSRATGLRWARPVRRLEALERARQSVSRRITNALSRIADHHLPFGQMLACCIKDRNLLQL